ncbi:MAG TPA: sensor histidine kinase [Jiangellaceae bacterium]|jgi:signal transduction histidine kinase|nr:sensor histidine kinase [Jiangellaceae bacterium]
MLLLATVLMVWEPLFFIFTITGFFHAALLGPWYATFLGVFATSVLINTVPFGVTADPTVADVIGYVSIIVIQTLAIGGGTVVGAKMTEQNEQRRRTLGELEAAVAENQALQAQLLTQAREAGVHDERQRIAGEIHDTLAQGLTGIITQLEAAEQSADQPAEWRRHIANASQLAREGLSEARRSVGAMRPEALEKAPLLNAIRDVVEQWSRMHGIPVAVATTGTARQLHPEIEVALLRTAQEALANVAKHANASKVWLTVSYMEDVVTLDVRDDGTGFQPGSAAASDGGFGLTGMRRRVSRVAGILEIESEPDGGTAISATVPAVATGSIDE